MKTSVSKIESIKKLVFARADELHAKGDLEGLRKFWKAKVAKENMITSKVHTALEFNTALELHTALLEEIDYIEKLGKDLRYQLDAIADNQTNMQLTLEV